MLQVGVIFAVEVSLDDLDAEEGFQTGLQILPPRYAREEAEHDTEELGDIHPTSIRHRHHSPLHAFRLPPLA